MKRQVFVFVGGPATGKSTIARRLARADGGWHHIAGLPIFSEDMLRWSSPLCIECQRIEDLKPLKKYLGNARLLAWELKPIKVTGLPRGQKGGAS
jgi:hypothetical protein